MASLQLVFLFVLPFTISIITCCMAQKPGVAQPYIVYMGRSFEGSEADDLSHLQLLSSLIASEESERKLLLHSYNHAFKGFSAMLTHNEASLLSGHDEVLSVFPDPLLQLHTTRSWDFIEAADPKLRSRYSYKEKSVDIIIGVIDTGVWPESRSFNDDDMGKIPSKWRGVCMEAPDFNKSNCNRKLIGARFYSEGGKISRGSPRDFQGHGTHTASIAGGAPVANANYYGLARGTVRGGFPSARIAIYKACSQEGCAGSVLLKAIDDAVKDKVDIISISIGLSSIIQTDFLEDPIAIGAFHAEEKGIMVVCSAGNDGPQPSTLSNSAPWIFTVAASTIDRAFQSTILLGNDKSYKGTAINFSSLKHDKRYPLAFAQDVAAEFSPASDARNCLPGSLDSKKVAGKIIVCMNENANVSKRIKRLVIEDAKGKGLIIVHGKGEVTPHDSGTYPFVEVADNIGSHILQYINSTKKPIATILQTKDIKGYKPAPMVASFSSRGPGSLTENILKPDITAPGVAILAAIVPRIESGYSAPGNRASDFSLKSGTSMACPHVSGAVAFIKSVHPNWTSSVIKSALMTTASFSNNIGRTMTNASYFRANPHEVGAGEIRPVTALDPGLVFKTTIKDHLSFLCYYGYNQKIIRSISKTNFTCPKSSKEELISNINYPSISIGELSRKNGPRKVKRVVTNIGSSPNATYYVSSVIAPSGLKVKVVPKTIVFKQGEKKKSFKVIFDGKKASKGYKFGHVSWFDGLHNVRLVFAVNIV